jgi:hypothetical protein
MLGCPRERLPGPPTHTAEQALTIYILRATVPTRIRYVLPDYFGYCSLCHIPQQPLPTLAISIVVRRGALRHEAQLHVFVDMLASLHASQEWVKYTIKHTMQPIH